MKKQASSEDFDSAQLQDGDLVAVFVVPYHDSINRLAFQFTKVVLVADNVDWSEGAVGPAAPLLALEDDTKLELY